MADPKPVSNRLDQPDGLLDRGGRVVFEAHGEGEEEQYLGVCLSPIKGYSEGSTASVRSRLTVANSLM